MKKYTDHIVKMTNEAKQAHLSKLAVDIASLSRGIIQKDVQNVHIVRAKRKELARTLTMIKQNKEKPAEVKPAKVTKKETK